MYIGPWQEYRLAQAVGGRGGQRRGSKSGPDAADGERAEASGNNPAPPRTVGGAPLPAALAGVDTAAVERLVAQIQAAGPSGTDATRAILRSFLEEHALSRQPGASPPAAAAAAATELDIDLDPNRTRALEERAKERRLVQARRERGPAKLQQVERRKADFLKNLAAKAGGPAAQASESSFLHEGAAELASDPGAATLAAADGPAFDPDAVAVAPLPNNQTKDGAAVADAPAGAPLAASILPTRPSLLLNSFLPAGGMVGAILSNPAVATRGPIGPAGVDNRQCGIQQLSDRGAAAEQARTALQAPLGLEPYQMGLPCLASAGFPASLLEERSPGQAPIQADVFIDSALGRAEVPEDALKEAREDLMATSADAAACADDNEQTQVDQDDNADQLGHSSEPGCTPAAAPPSLLDDDVEDLVNWSKNLGLGSDDDFLFES